MSRQYQQEEYVHTQGEDAREVACEKSEDGKVVISNTKSRLPLPRSRTFNVLSSFTSSLKPSLSNPQMAADEGDDEPLLPKTTLPSSFTRPELRKHTMLASDQHSPTLDNTENLSPNSVASNPTMGLKPSISMFSFRRFKGGAIEDVEEDDPRYVREAMPSQYWTGRFVGLSDRLRNETHQEQLKVISELEADMYPSLFHGGPEAVNSEEEQFTRAKRVFVQLDLFCRTKEAHDSLRAFQEDYANKFNEERLLPRVAEGGLLRKAGSILAQTLSPRSTSSMFTRSSSFQASGAKPKKTNLGTQVNHGTIDDEEDQLINFKVRKSLPEKTDSTKPRIITPTRIPTPSFLKSRRSSSGQSISPVAVDILLDDINNLSSGRKISTGYGSKTPASKTPSRGVGQNVRAPSISNIKSPVSTPSRPLHPIGTSRDRSMSNLSNSTRYQPRRSNNPNETGRATALGASRSQTVSNMSGIGSRPPRPSLPRDNTVRVLRTAETKARVSIPKNRSMTAMSSAMTSNQRPLRHPTPSRNNVTPSMSSAQIPIRRPLRQSISHGSVATPSMGSAKISENRKTPTRTYTPSKIDIIRPLAVKRPQQNIPLPPIPRSISDSLYTTPSKKHPRISDVSKKSRVSENISEESVAVDEDSDIWRLPSKLFSKKRSPETLQSFTGTGAERLGEPCWDSRGVPFYILEGKRIYVPSRLREEGDGEDWVVSRTGALIAKKMIAEKKEETWRRVVEKKRVEREKERRMVEEGMEVERLGAKYEEDHGTSFL